MRDSSKALLLGLALSTTGCDLSGLVLITPPRPTPPVPGAPQPPGGPVGVTGTALPVKPTAPVPQPTLATAPPGPLPTGMVIGPNQPGPNCKEVFAQYDRDQSGGWDYEEFKQYWTSRGQNGGPMPTGPMQDPGNGPGSVVGDPGPVTTAPAPTVATAMPGPMPTAPQPTIATAPPGTIGPMPTAAQFDPTQAGTANGTVTAGAAGTAVAGTAVAMPGQVAGGVAPTWPHPTPPTQPCPPSAGPQPTPTVNYPQPTGNYPQPTVAYPTPTAMPASPWPTNMLATKLDTPVYGVRQVAATATPTPAPKIDPTTTAPIVATPDPNQPPTTIVTPTFMTPPPVTAPAPTIYPKPTPPTAYPGNNCGPTQGDASAIFKLFDRNGDGVLDPGEVCDLLSKGGKQPTPQPTGPVPVDPQPTGLDWHQPSAPPTPGPVPMPTGPVSTGPVMAQ